MFCGVLRAPMPAIFLVTRSKESNPRASVGMRRAPTWGVSKKDVQAAMAKYKAAKTAAKAETKGLQNEFNVLLKKLAKIGKTHGVPVEVRVGNAGTIGYGDHKAGDKALAAINAELEATPDDMHKYLWDAEDTIYSDVVHVYGERAAGMYVRDWEVSYC